MVTRLNNDDDPETLVKAIYAQQPNCKTYLADILGVVKKLIKLGKTLRTYMSSAFGLAR